jgi:hypothetical protein
MRFISVLPAQPGYLVQYSDEYWEPVIAWGFDEFGNPPEPLTVRGAVPRDDIFVELRVKDPTGRVVVV